MKFKKICWLVITISLLGGCGGKSTLVKVTENGNILFYNYPAAIKNLEGYFIGYVTNNGEVKVSNVNKTGQIVREELVHDYEKDLNADDHAAPSIILDDMNVLWLATSYQASVLYLYKMDLNASDPKWQLQHTYNGEYTYPRFVVMDDNKKFLFVRSEQGFSVFKYTNNSFEKEYITLITRSNSDEYIYVTKPTIYNNKIYIGHNTYSVSSNKRKGVYYTELLFKDSGTIDVKTKNLSKVHNFLSPWIMDIYVRNDDSVTLLLSDKKEGAFRAGGQNTIYKIMHFQKKEESSLEEISTHQYVYYPSVAVINKYGVLYEYNSGMRSIGVDTDCVINDMFRPSFIDKDRSFLMLKNNRGREGKYWIRDFNTSLYLCIES